MSRVIMGRTKSKQNSWLPKYVKLHKGRYVYTPYKGCVNGKPVWGKEIVLGRIGEPKSVVYQRYEEVTGKGDRNTLKLLLDGFMDSSEYKELSRKTRVGYQKFYNIIVEKQTSSGPFGNHSLEKITPPVIKKYLDLRKQEGAAISGNKEIGLISSAWSWLYQRQENVPQNPCKGVRRNPHPPRQHYVEDRDYWYVFNMAGPWYVPVIMEIAYLCRMRKGEVLDLRESDILQQGLNTRRTKGSKSAITKWSPRLRAAVDKALSIQYKVKPLASKDRYLIHDGHGEPIKESSFDSAWWRRIKKAMSEGITRFTLHDLKRKGVSDFDGDKLKASGHIDPNMMKVYDVRPDEVDATR